MQIKLTNYNSLFNENKNYNRDINSFVIELMETISTGRIKYKISEIDNFHSNKRHRYFSQIDDKEEYLNPQKDESFYKNYLKYAGFGPLEFSLASYLLNKDIKYNVIILTGALGSGKSSLSKYTLKLIESLLVDVQDPLHFPKDSFIRNIDFNKNFSSNIKDEQVEEFKLLLINKLQNVMEKIHLKNLFILPFLNKLKIDETDYYDYFSDFVRKLRAEDKPTEELKFDFLLNWLDSFNHNLSFKLGLIAKILAFIKENNGNGDNIDFIILFDNLDNLNDDVQVEILNIIFSFSVDLPIKFLVPVRLTTFGKVKGNGSHNFGVFQNTGQPPIIILRDRIKHFLNNIEEYKVSQKISKEYEKLFLDKVRYIEAILDDTSNTNRISKFFTAIAGNSIRRGLYLAERFFLNSVIRFDDKILFQDEFLKALLVSDRESCKLSNNDTLVNNIIATSENTNTLLKLRILQLLDFFRENNLICKINMVITQINLFEEYSTDEILDAINSLIHTKRRLLYIEGVTEYSDGKNLLQSMNDIIHISYSGIEYLNTLLYDTVYLQNCFISTDWRIPYSFKKLDYLTTYLDKIYEINKRKEIEYLKNLVVNKKITITDFIAPSYDYKDIGERMKLIRDCLYFLLLNDLNQIAMYYEKNNIHNQPYVQDLYITRSIIIDIVAKISLNVLFILKSNQTNTIEIQYWYDFLLITDLWHNAIFKTRNKSLEHSISVFNEIHFK